MTERTIVTLRAAPSATVEVPEENDGKKLQRSCFGALRLFPGIPKTVTKDELEHIKQTEPDLYLRLTVQPYVESKRVDKRGAGEAEIARLAAEEGIDHLPLHRQAEVLRERGKIAKQEAPGTPESPKPSDRRTRGGGK